MGTIDPLKAFVFGVIFEIVTERMFNTMLRRSKNRVVISIVAAVEFSIYIGLAMLLLLNGD